MTLLTDSPQLEKMGARREALARRAELVGEKLLRGRFLQQTGALVYKHGERRCCRGGVAVCVDVVRC